MATLFIIGNGFDLHHGLRTSYANYKEFLENGNWDAVEEFMEITSSANNEQESWTNIESALKINYTDILHNCINKINDQRLIEDYLDSGMNDLYNAAEYFLRKENWFITDFTGRMLYEWLDSVNTESAVPDQKMAKQFTEDDRFLCFNYTNTLETVYQIPKQNILYIHGNLQKLSKIEERVEYLMNDSEDNNLEDQNAIESIEDDLQDLIDIFAPEGDDEGLILLHEERLETNYYYEEFAQTYSFLVRRELQFGADIDIETALQDVAEVVDGQDELHEDAVKEIEYFIDHSIKETNRNIGILKRFVQQKPFTNVVIMGHTLSANDYPYYRDVIVPTLNSCEWKFFIHSNKSYKDLLLFLRMVAQDCFGDEEINTQGRCEHEWW